MIPVCPRLGRRQIAFCRNRAFTGPRIGVIRVESLTLYRLSYHAPLKNYETHITVPELYHIFIYWMNLSKITPRENKDNILLFTSIYRFIYAVICYLISVCLLLFYYYFYGTLFEKSDRWVCNKEIIIICVQIMMVFMK